MELKNELELIEKERNVYRAVEYIKEERNKSLDNYLRVVFILLDFLVEGQHEQNDWDFISVKIKQIFNDAKLKYSSNYDFLFFSGIMIYIAEWYFGIDNIDEAKFMLDDIMKSNPDNVVYKWAYFSVIDQRVEINTEIKQHLSAQILGDESILEWLKSKGLLGEYVLGIIQGTYATTKKLLNENNPAKQDL